MFIKITLIRISTEENTKDQEIEIPTLQNLDDVKQFQLNKTTSKITVVYKGYSDIGEETDEIKEDTNTIIERLEEAKLYNKTIK
jgi:hypothetical protein